MNIFYRLLKKKHLQKEKKRNIYTNNKHGSTKAQREQANIHNVIFHECLCLIFENVYVLRAVQLACYGGS